MPRKLNNYTIRYDWMKWNNGTEMNGYGTSMLLEPIPTDRKTNKRAVKDGKPAEWTKEDWERRKPPKSIAIRWMLPAQPRRLTRILTLLQLLRGGYLIGQAALDVEALRVIIRGGKMPLKRSESESWANDIISQERETLSKLRKRCIDGEVLAR